MDLQQYRKFRDIKNNVEEEVVEKLLENRFEKYSSFISESNFEEKVYLANFFSKKEDKPFYRNLERIYKGNLDNKEIKKVLSSCLTYLFIEKEDGEQVSEKSIDYLLELLENIRKDSYTCKEVVEELRKCYEIS